MTKYPNLPPQERHNHGRVFNWSAGGFWIALGASAAIWLVGFLVLKACS